MNGRERRLFGLLGLLLAMLAWPAQAQTVVKYVHTDALGSVVAVTDANRNVIERREYEPFGAQLTPAVQDGPGYTGHVQDAATGLVYMQQRYYDAGTGRFLSVDPVTALSDPVGYFGRYHYANNNPYKFTDPDGRAWGLAAKVVKVIVKGGDVAATVAGAVEDGQVLFSRDATLGQRVLAGASLATEVFSPVSARDVKAGAAAIKGADKATDAARVGDLPKPPTGPGSVPASERDPKRLFTPSEREAKRAEQGNQCATGCGTTIDASNSRGHHVERHADGGPTTSANHAEVCTTCHDKLHSRDNP